MKTNDRRKAPLGQGGVGDSVGLVAFDADDTLWDCQGAFCAVEHALAELLSPYAEATRSCAYWPPRSAATCR